MNRRIRKVVSNGGITEDSTLDGTTDIIRGLLVMEWFATTPIIA